MAELENIPLTYIGLIEVVTDLRPADVQECEGWGGYVSPALGVAHSAHRSRDAFEVIILNEHGNNGEAIAVWGLSVWGLSGVEDEAEVWFVARPALERFAKTFTKLATKVLREKARARGYRRISAVADPRNVRHVAWLNRVGFKKVGDCVTPAGNTYHRMVLDVSP